jgi:hypothetical protein
MCAAVACCENAALAIVRLLTRPVVFGEQTVLLIEESDRDGLEAWRAITVGRRGNERHR